MPPWADTGLIGKELIRKGVCKVTEQQKNDFLNKVVLQVKTNRFMHDDDKEISAQEWAIIAGEHMGHLFNAVRVGDMAQAEKELLHVAAPLMELHQAITYGKGA